jgi:hypothetical protein
VAVITINRSGRFPVGTVVGLFPAGAVPAGAGTNRPPGAAQVTSATVAADGSLTFSGVTAETPYAAYALVGGEHRVIFVRSSTWTPQVSWKARLAARKAALGFS